MHILPKKDSSRNLLAIVCLAQFAVNFSFGFALVFLPFYIRKLSPYPPQQTLLWIGAILGATGTCVAFSAPVWGALTHRIKPRLLYLFGLAAHVFTFGAMGFVSTLPMFLILRVLQGIFGGTATVGLIIISFGPEVRRSRDLGILQSSITLGILVGPPLGTLAEHLFGFRGGFLTAAVVLCAAFLVSLFGVPSTPPVAPRPRNKEKRSIGGGVIAGWLLITGAQVQLAFLPSIFPDVFHFFGIPHNRGLTLAGLLIALFTAAAMVGSYLWTAAASRTGVKRMITWLIAAGAMFQAALILPRGIVGFSVICLVQSCLVAAIAPLTLSLYAGKARGSVIGFLYSSRSVGNAVGPMMATSILACSNLPTLYLAISAFCLLSLWVFKFTNRDEIEPTSIRPAPPVDGLSA